MADGNNNGKTAAASALTMDKLVALCKTRGFVYPGSEIYGGLANAWDYGPLGVLLKNNVKAAWWKKFVTESPYNVGIDCAVLMNPKTWEASGHLAGFSDPLTDCKSCKTRHRADNIVDDYIARKKRPDKTAGWTNEQFSEYIKANKIPCPNCGASDFTPIKKFNLMFKTFQGVDEDTASTVYLRPETAQGIFVNFRNLMRTNRARLPFGVAQIGKSFRNEITPRNFIYRIREFEQMELEFFCKPGTDLEWFDYWKNFCKDFLTGLGMREQNLKLRDHQKEELSHYSKATTDFEFLFPFGWGELWGIADRTDFDLMCHQKASGQSMEYTDPVTNEKFVPYCIEPSLGVDRVLLAFLCDAYDEESLGENDVRTVLRLHNALAPYKAAVLPLQKNLSEYADNLYADLRKDFSCAYDLSGSIGKRYRRQDEIGTPYCVTVDFDTLADDTVTVRDRDTMTQERVAAAKLKEFFAEKLRY
ncbi:MAG: glycine--tRNA ligase [Clostridiales bacterium]|jgi:glycyl-tRNA synthetase|nr:glycine--tRNA ligase [Clostridiales bacterium]